MDVRGGFCAIVACVLLAGCAGGIPEFGLYSKAFDVQFEQGNSVLDRFAEAERRTRLNALPDETDEPTFDPANATLYFERLDTPIAGALRQSLVTVHEYNLALAALASGETDRVTLTRIADFATNLAATAASLRGLPGEAEAAGLVAAGVKVEKLVPVFDQLAKFAGQAAFRSQFSDAYPAMRDLLGAIRAYTPTMFDVMRESYVDPKITRPRSGIAETDYARLMDDRRALAGWVVLIDQTLVAMREADAAVRSGSTISSAALLESSTELRVLAERVRVATSRP